MDILSKAEKVEIVTIIDNYVDVLLPSLQNVARKPPYQNGTVAPPLVAEHGLSLLVRVYKKGKPHTVLMDAGWSESGAQHNIKELGIAVSEVEGIVLSHGHMDHHGGLKVLLRERGRSVPVIAHPNVFQKDRYLVSLQGQKVTLPILDKESLVELGAQIVETRKPYSLELYEIAGSRCLGSSLNVL